MSTFLFDNTNLVALLWLSFAFLPVYQSLLFYMDRPPIPDLHISNVVWPAFSKSVYIISICPPCSNASEFRLNYNSAVWFNGFSINSYVMVSLKCVVGVVYHFDCNGLQSCVDGWSECLVIPVLSTKQFSSSWSSALFEICNDKAWSACR